MSDLKLHIKQSIKIRKTTVIVEYEKRRKFTAFNAQS